MQRISQSSATITPAPTLSGVRELRRQQFGQASTVAYPSTCGYEDGIESQARVAAPGWVCTTDPSDDLWGFCQLSLYTVNACKLGGACVDIYSCSSACGHSGGAVSTFTCPTSSYCTNAYLTVGDTAIYTYLGCGATPAEQHLLPSFITTTDPSTSSTTSSSTSSTISSSTSSSTSSPSTTTPTSLIPTSTTSLAPVSVASGTSQPVASKNNTGPIVGGVVGGLAVICLTVLAIFLLKRRRKVPVPVPVDNVQEVRHPVHQQAPYAQRWSELEGDATKPHGQAYPTELEANAHQR